MQIFHQTNPKPQILYNRTIAYPPHLHRDMELVGLFSGSATVTLDGVSYEMRSGDWVMVFPDVVHSYESTGAVEVGKLIFPPEEVPELAAILTEQLPDPPLISAERLKDSTIPMLAQEIFTHYANASLAVKKAYLLLLCGKLLECTDTVRRENAAGGAVTAVLDYCRAHYHEKICLQSVASALYFSRSYVSHIFCEKLRISFCHYLNSLRIEEAKQRLLSGNVSITELSAQCGFSNLRSFHRAFARYTGLTPKQYLASYIQKEKEPANLPQNAQTMVEKN